MTAHDLVDVALPVGTALVIGLIVIFADAAKTIRDARAMVARPTSTFGPTNEGPELELPTYQPGPCDPPFRAGTEADVRQALANIAEGRDPIDPAAVQRIWNNVADELAARRGVR